MARSSRFVEFVPGVCERGGMKQTGDGKLYIDLSVVDQFKRCFTRVSLFWYFQHRLTNLDGVNTRFAVLVLLASVD